MKKTRILSLFLALILCLSLLPGAALAASEPTLFLDPEQQGETVTGETSHSLSSNSTQSDQVVPGTTQKYTLRVYYQENGTQRLSSEEQYLEGTIFHMSHSSHRLYGWRTLSITGGSDSHYDNSNDTTSFSVRLTSDAEVVIETYDLDVTFNITYVLNGAGEAYSVPVKNGASTVLPDAPSLPGYRFLGWYDGEVEGRYLKKYGSASYYTENIRRDRTFYAMWEKEEEPTTPVETPEPEETPADKPVDPSESVPYEQKILVDGKTIWIGMTKEQLVDTMGMRPAAEVPSVYEVTWALFRASDWSWSFAAGIGTDGTVGAIQIMGSNWSWKDCTAGTAYDDSKLKLSEKGEKALKARVANEPDTKALYALALCDTLVAFLPYEDNRLVGESQLIYYFTNTYRVIHGLKALTWSEGAEQAALGHSVNMATNDFFSHMDQDRCLVMHRLTEAGVGWSGCAENIVAGVMDGFDAVICWVNSSGHRANILRPNHTHFGDGGAANHESTYYTYWTEVFYHCGNAATQSESDSATSAVFSDVADNSPFAPAIGWAVEQGITNGTTPTTFAPGTTCTTGHILTFLWRSQGSPESTIANPYTDEIPSAFQKAAIWAYEKGLVSGTTFGSATPCTRAASVTYMWKLAGSPEAKAASFKDVAATSDYAKAVSWAVEQGVTNGTTATTFAPGNTTTRGQIVTFLYRAYQ